MKEQRQMKQAGHGDLYVRQIAEIPAEVRRLMKSTPEPVTLAYGEKTGHAHVLTSEKPIEYVRVDDMRAYAILSAAGVLVHEPNGADHGTRVLAPGAYEIDTEREYDPTLYQQRVVD